MTTVEPDSKDLKSLDRLAWRGNVWFIVMANPQSDLKAAQDLRRGGLRVYVPKRYREVMRRKAKAVRNRPLLAGYLFVRFPLGMGSSEALYAIAHGSAAVHDVVSYEDRAGQLRPYPIADQAVRDFIERQRRRQFGKPFVDTEDQMLERQRGIFTPGRKVRVTTGPFVGREALVERFGGLNDVEALIEGLGRATRVHFTAPEQELEALPDGDPKRLAKPERGLSESAEAA